MNDRRCVRGEREWEWENKRERWEVERESAACYLPRPCKQPSWVRPWLMSIPMELLFCSSGNVRVGLGHVRTHLNSQTSKTLYVCVWLQQHPVIAASWVFRGFCCLSRSSSSDFCVFLTFVYLEFSLAGVWNGRESAIAFIWLNPFFIVWH